MKIFIILRPAIKTVTVDEILWKNPAEFLGSAQITLWNPGMHMEFLRSETSNEENIFSFPFYLLL